MDSSSVRILAICGSLQARSANRALVEAAVQGAPEGVVVTPYFALAALPHFCPDLDGEAPPIEVAELRQKVAAHDALLIACPEYGHSLPGALKNAIDWLIPSGELEQKTVAITASTPALVRGRLGLRALRDTLYAVRADVLGGEPIVRDEQQESRLRALVGALSARVRARRPAAPRAATVEVQIGPARTEDAATYSAFLLAGVAAHPDTLRIAEVDIQAAPFSTEPTADSVTLVARDAAGRWLGVASVERERGRAKRRHIAWILRMYVAAEHAGRGIGRRLLQAAIAHARSLPGVEKVNLTVAAHNASAIQLYTQEGFREFAREVDAFRSPQSQTELSMSLSLAW
jgi:NAD(P)H-dependent FMN reductase/GNAT superfamily N-acetyltransferase